MNIPQQIESISIARAANAAHYEYLATVRGASTNHGAKPKFNQ